MAFRKLFLLLAALGSTGLVLAQRPAVAPLAPVTSTVAAPTSLGTVIVITKQSAAQPAAPMPDRPPRPIQPEPVYIVNSQIIVGGIGLSRINPHDIAKIEVLKELAGPIPAKWRRLAANGIIAITLKPHVAIFETESLAAISQGLRVRGPVRYQLDGLPIKDLTLRVAMVDIATLDQQPTSSGTVVNIHLAVPPPVVYPPGTILIRGTAGL